MRSAAHKLALTLTPAWLHYTTTFRSRSGGARTHASLTSWGLATHTHRAAEGRGGEGGWGRGRDSGPGWKGGLDLQSRETRRKHTGVSGTETQREPLWVWHFEQIRMLNSSRPSWVQAAETRRSSPVGSTEHHPGAPPVQLEWECSSINAGNINIP